MPDLPAGIRSLLKARRLDRVEADVTHAEETVATAEKHLRTAAVLAGTEDQAMAFTAAYDGARKALSAVLAMEGLRVRPVGGAHRNTGIAAAEFVGADALGDFEWMRQVRNATEYPSTDRPGATEQDVREAMDAATDIVAACADYVRGR